MKARVILSIWIFVSSIVMLLASAALISTTLGAYTPAHIASYGPRIPAFSAAISAQAANYPLYLLIAAGLSVFFAIYYWRSARPAETKSFAVTLIAAINMFLAANFSITLLIGYFLLPKLANGA